MNKLFHKTRLGILRAMPAAIILLAVFGAAVMLLWNALMPDILGLPAIGYLQAVGLLALTRILFGGVGRGLGWGDPRLHDRNAFREKWMKMTPEEREDFIRKQGHYHHLFGGRYHDDGEPRPDTNQETKQDL
jgi:hypothetical protein